MSASLVEGFSQLEDPRLARNKLHALTDIIVLTICAVASGADGWGAIEDFGKINWLGYVNMFYWLMVSPLIIASLMY